MERADLAPEKQHGITVSAVHVHDASEHKPMIAGIDNFFNPTVDPGKHTIEDRGSGFGRSPGDAVKLVVTRFGETPTQIVLPVGQHVDAKGPGVTNEWPRRRRFLRQKSNEWWVHRYRRE